MSKPSATQQLNVHAYKRKFSENGARALMGGGAVLKFLTTSEDTNGLYSMFEAVGIPGMEPPAHTHTNEDETYYILEGKMWFKAGDKEFTATAGDYVFLPRNVKHEFKILSDYFRCQVAVFPAALDEYFMAISQPHNSTEIPPLATTPPTEEQLQQLANLNEKYGIIQ